MEKPHMDQLKKLQRASGFSKNKVAYFQHSKDSYTRYRHATRHFKRLPAFAKRINEIWCLDPLLWIKFWILIIELSIY